MTLSWRLIFSILVTIWTCAVLTFAGQMRAPHAATGTRRYDKAHSLGDNYRFDPRDGWHSVNASDFQYKYSLAPPPLTIHRRGAKDESESRASGVGVAKVSTSVQANNNDPVGGTLKGILKTLKGLVGIGKPEPVTITWWVSSPKSVSPQR